MIVHGSWKRFHPLRGLQRSERPRHPVAHWAGALLCALIFTGTDSNAATNTFDNVSVTTNALAVTTPGAGNTTVQIWTNGATFDVITNIAVSASGGLAAFEMNGSTGVVEGVGTSGSIPVINLQTVGIGEISLMNSLLTVTNNASWLWINSAQLGVLSLTNSTLRVRGTGNQGLYIDFNGGQQGFVGGVITNLLFMQQSTLDLGGQPLSVGFAGSFGGGNVQNSLITNVTTLGVGNNGSIGNLVVSNSTIVSPAVYPQYAMQIGSVRSGTLTLDHSTWLAPSAPFGYVGSSNGASVVYLLNGSLMDLHSENTGIGRYQGHGAIVVSNSTLRLAITDVGGWGTYFPGEINSVGVLSNASGSVTVSTLNLGTVSGGHGTYSGTGSSLLVAPAIVVGKVLSSTGTLTLAGTSSVVTTNSSKTGSISVGTAGVGLFDIQGGTLLADNLSVGTNGVLTSAPGQLWTLKVNFANLATNNLAFNLKGATLEFVSGGSHTLDVAGADLGGYVDGASVAVGSVNNFALDALQLGAATDTVTLHDPNGGGGGALYIDSLLLPGSNTNLVANIHSIAGLNIYYRWDDPRSYYLNAQTYGLTGGGLLIAIPEPSSLAFLGVGTVGVWILRLRRRRP